MGIQFARNPIFIRYERSPLRCDLGAERAWLCSTVWAIDFTFVEGEQTGSYVSRSANNQCHSIPGDPVVPTADWAGITATMHDRPCL